MLPRTRPAAVLILKSAYLPCQTARLSDAKRLPPAGRKCNIRVLQTSHLQEMQWCGRNHRLSWTKDSNKRVRSLPAVFSSAFFQPAYRLLLVFMVLMASAPAHAQQTTDYNALFRRCAANEVLALQHPQLFHFSERIEWDWGTETRDVIETAQGRADRIVAFHDESLAADQQRKQYRRLKKLLDDPKALREELDDQKSERERRIKMARALPDAVSIEFSGAESNGQLRFTFAPNPHFSAKDRETKIYSGMRGTLWLDPHSERLTHVRGELFKDVSFGWGIVGRLRKGGKYEAAQTQVAPHVWRITTLNLDFHGTILLFGSQRILRKESSSKFSPTPPDMTFKKAAEHLLTAYPSGLLSHLRSAALPERPTD